MRVEAILFDKDGTLFEFAATWGPFARAFVLRVAENDPDRATRIGHTVGYDMAADRFDPDSVLIAATADDIARDLRSSLPHLSHAALVDLLNEEAALAPQAQHLPLAPYLDALLGRGLKLGVATNDSEIPALSHLEAAGIRDRFEFVAGFDSGHGAKPGTGQLLAFAAHVGLDPAQVVMVGDSTHDLMAGRAAGMVTIGVLTGLAGADVLAPFADAVLPDIGHIPAWLDR